MGPLPVGTDMKLYDEYAPWWPLVSAPEDYAEEAAFFHQVFSEHGGGAIHTLLELGCGGGNNALFLKKNYAMTLTDLSPAMLDMSRRMNPECTHVQGDMRRLRLGQTFDAVFIHDAVGYMTSKADLQQVMATAAHHCREGGLVLFVPDYVRETFAESTSRHGRDDERRALRYLEWIFDPNPQDSTYIMAFAFLFREADGSLWSAHEQHVLGLFGREEWLDLLRQAGFSPTAILDTYGRDLFLGKKEHESGVSGQ